jgi:predicted RNA-binding Zn ribbon-like protein
MEENRKTVRDMQQQLEEGYAQRLLEVEAHRAAGQMSMEVSREARETREVRPRVFCPRHGWSPPRTHQCDTWLSYSPHTPASATRRGNQPKLSRDAMPAPRISHINSALITHPLLALSP